MSPTPPPGFRLLLPGVIVFALLAALALGVNPGLAALDGGSNPEIVTAGDTPGYLQPAADGPTREWVGRVEADASVAVTEGSHRLHGRFERLAADERYGATEQTAERERLLRRHVTELDGRVERLLAARDRAVGAHSGGELSTAEFVRQLARVDAAAARAERFRSGLLDRARSAGSSNSFQTSLVALEVDLASVRGMATERTRDRVVGRADGEATYVQTVGDRSLVVATVGDGDFLRDALDGSQWQPGADRFASGDELGFAAAYRRAEELYPWTFGANVAPGPATPYVNTSVYSITADHAQGQLVTYLDGTTENVFREIQQKRLGVLPQRRLGTETGDGLRLSLNATHPTGPLDVRVTDADSGRAVDGTIRVDGSPVGTTGSDGRLWTVQPDGAFTVNATRGEESVEMTVT